ncbi:hypothetical protein PpBr36_07973 [Pyricularia pennisetigena]|uniref:hypothetical protein n=1 Tax=Pyricularia pennisetigena TaxID=1578925 RepID=UPI001154B9D3|nr:hypothetical protein PpBr36_07973 [Pyricularia pennisetigena]TLS23961.1 hypothetical protein PpBr36_07973 [Pyricularia pennisetigena]
MADTTSKWNAATNWHLRCPSEELRLNIASTTPTIYSNICMSWQPGRTSDTEGRPRMPPGIPDAAYDANTNGNGGPYLHQHNEQHRDPDVARQDRLRCPVLPDRQLRGR